MSIANKASEQVGEIKRGALYRELTLVSELLELVSEALPATQDGGISAATEIARRMVDDLAMKVSP